MKKFRHLSLEEREKLYLWHETGISNREIGKRLGRDHKAIGYELEQNTKYGNKYMPCIAQKRAKRVGSKQRYKAPLKNPQIFLYVREKLRIFWSPEIIAGRIGIDIKNASIHKDTIYEYIYSNAARKYKLWRYLTCGRPKKQNKLGRKVHNKGKVPNAVSIDKRSKSVLKRKQIGHWETDNVEGIRSSKPALSVTVERAIRFHIITKIPNQTALVKSNAIVKRLKHYPSTFLKSITCDNGKENYAHQITSNTLDVSIYFCHAYHSWEKPTVENRNKSIRKFFPKGTDFTKVSVKQVQAVENILNNTPMKCLDFRTPYEIMQKKLSLVTH